MVRKGRHNSTPRVVNQFSRILETVDQVFISHIIYFYGVKSVKIEIVELFHRTDSI